MKKFLLLFTFAIVASLLSGCISRLKSETAPGTNLSSIKKVYVVHLPVDGRRVDRLIADRLNLMGREATYGEKNEIPADAQAIVTYQDKWMWDITMYMIELNVQIRNPKSEIALATGHSLRTSLVRKSPPDMVEEVLTDLFKQ